ncbi:MAG: dihydrolipoamide acetyltransferase family protein [Fastidiosipilaceae bacterium]|jgi:pyruvate dehydrogenase E2 component (dihydrolipoamide acetyltransferase)|nr:2-oxo acid dehydrogenase subunit E2 [Clostridiaceae bacterium]
MEIIKVPMIGLSEESAIVASYSVKVGDTVEIGDTLFSIENGKATYDVASEVAGTVLAILIEEGDEVPVQTPAIVVGEPGEEYVPEGGAAPVAAVEAAPAETSAAAPVADQALTPESLQSMLGTESQGAAPVAGGHIPASPRARALAERSGLDLSLVTQMTGPDGIIIERDVMASLDKAGQAPAAEVATKPAPAAQAVPAPTRADQIVKAVDVTYQDRKMSPARRAIADNLLAATNEMAQASMTTSFDATGILALRKKFKASNDPVIQGIGLGDMVYYAVTRVVKDFPFFNAHIIKDTYIVREFDHVQLGVAVDTPKGLLVPVVRNADLLTLGELSQEIKRLSGQCRDGNIDPALLQGASITVSNMGNAAAETFIPIVNPPQVAIVGICRIDYRVRESKDGGIELYKAMPLALTIDHRVSDGTPSGKFMAMICYYLENFTELLAKG